MFRFVRAAGWALLDRDTRKGGEKFRDSMGFVGCRDVVGIDQATVPPLRKPTRSQEVNAKEKVSAHCGRDDTLVVCEKIGRYWISVTCMDWSIERVG